MLRYSLLGLTSASVLIACSESPAPQSEAENAQPSFSTEATTGETVQAETEEFDHTQSAVRQFAGICVREINSPERIEAMAELGDWEPLPEEAVIALAPQESSVPWSGWTVQSYGETPVIVAVSDSSEHQAGSLSGGRGCTMAAGTVVDPSVFRDRISNLLDLAAPDQEWTEMGQRTTFWRLPSDNQVLFITDAEELGSQGVTASVLTIEQ